MAGVIAKRVLGSIGAVFGASVIAFLIMRVLPGDPARLIVGPLAQHKSLVSAEEQLGINKSLFSQYWIFVKDFFTGEWGFSFSTGAPVKTLLVEKFPATIELALAGAIATTIATIFFALLVTYRHRPVADRIVRFCAYVGFGTPPFFAALLMLIIFSTGLHWLPGPEGRLSQGFTAPPTVTHLYPIDSLLAGDWSTFVDSIEHLILPGLALGLASWSFLVRLLRANLLEVSREPFLTVARGKGLSRWTAFRRHALPNAFLPTLTATGLMLGEFLAGSVLVEQIFNWPGVGQLVLDAILKQDYAVVETFILLSAVLFVVVNLIVDLLYAVIDPRVRVPSLATA